MTSWRSFARVRMITSRSWPSLRGVRSSRSAPRQFGQDRLIGSKEVEFRGCPQRDRIDEHLPDIAETGTIAANSCAGRT